MSDDSINASIDFESIRTRGELAHLLDNHDERDTNDILRGVGVERTLAHAVKMMASNYSPSGSVRPGYVYWDVHHDDTSGGCWFGSDAAGIFTFGTGQPENAGVRVELKLLDFLRVLAERLDPSMAVLTRKIKVDGDLRLALNMRTWFKPDD